LKIQGLSEGESLGQGGTVAKRCFLEIARKKDQDGQRSTVQKGREHLTTEGRVNPAKGKLRPPGNRPWVADHREDPAGGRKKGLGGR